MPPITEIHSYRYATRSLANCCFHKALSLSVRASRGTLGLLILILHVAQVGSAHEKVVKLFLKFISHFSRRAVDRASIRTRYVGPCFDPLFAAKGGTLLSQCRSLMLSFRRESAIVPNRPSSVAVLSWLKSSPERLPRRAVRGLGAHSPNQTGSSHGGKGFIRFTGFPEREEQYGELSCDSDDGSLLGLGCSLLGET